MTTETPATRAIPRSLFLFAIFYGGMVCIAGVLANKQVALGPLAVEAGIFAFLMLVVTSSAVTELYGAKMGRRMVMYGFIPLIISSLLTVFILSLPAAAEMDPERLSAYELILASTPRIWLGGIIAYGISTLLNVWIFDKMRRNPETGFETEISNLKTGTSEKYDVAIRPREKDRNPLLWLRAAVAGMVSQALDTLIFISIAFYGVFPIFELMLGQMLAKVVLSAIAFPPLITLMVALARKIDREPSA